MIQDLYNKKFWYNTDKILLAWSLKKDYEKRNLIYSKDYRKKLDKLYGINSSKFLTYFFSKKNINNEELEGLLINFIEYGFIKELYIENNPILIKYAEKVILNKIDKKWLIKNRKYSEKNFLFSDNFVTYLVIIIDYNKLNNYINEYLDKWFNGKIIKHEEPIYLKEDLLIQKVLTGLSILYKKYGEQIPYGIDFSLKDYDFVTPLFFLEKRGYINIDKYPNIVGKKKYSLNIKESNIIYIDINKKFIGENNKLLDYNYFLSSEGIKVNNILKFNNISLYYGIENSIKLSKLQLKFAKFIFKKNVIGDKKFNFSKCEEYIYGDNTTPPDTGLIGIIKKINKHIEELGCNQYFSYADSDYILFETRKIL